MAERGGFEWPFPIPERQETRIPEQNRAGDIQERHSYNRSNNGRDETSPLRKGNAGEVMVSMNPEPSIWDPRPHPPRSSSFDRIGKAVAIGAAAIVGVLGILSVTTVPKPGGTSAAANSQRQDAHYTAEQFIRKQCPGTGGFSSFRESVVDVEGGVYRVALNVDGVNSFGGPVRKAMVVTMRLSGDKWQLLGIDER